MKHMIEFDPAVVKEAVTEALKVYNHVDHLHTVMRLVKEGEIIPHNVAVEQTKDGKAIVSILEMDGREAALTAMVEYDMTTQGAIFHFSAGWCAAKGLLKVKPESDPAEVNKCVSLLRG